MHEHAQRHGRLLNATNDGLALDALDAYLGDMRAWVAARCRIAICAAAGSGRLGRRPGAVLEALFGPHTGRAPECIEQANAIERVAADQFARWTDLAPHVALGRELGLSAASVAILVLATAPYLWGDLAHVYRMIAPQPDRALVDKLFVGELLDVDAARELDPGAPLITSGACRVGGSRRPDGAVTVHPLVVRRLAGARAPWWLAAEPMQRRAG